jgi:hypothetical protein
MGVNGQREDKGGSRTRTRTRKVNKEHVAGRGGHKFKEAELQEEKAP